MLQYPYPRQGSRAGLVGLSLRHQLVRQPPSFHQVSRKHQGAAPVHPLQDLHPGPLQVKFFQAEATHFLAHDLLGFPGDEVHALVMLRPDPRRSDVESVPGFQELE